MLILFNCLIWLMMIIYIFISLAFLTLLERKILSLMQLRKGPNKVGLIGIFQPFADATKLLMKENLIILSTFKFLFILSPLLMVTFMLLMFLIYPYVNNYISMHYSFLYMISLFSLMVYPLLYMGWSSFSNYAILGSLRLVIQGLSYEVVIILFFFFFIFFIESLSLKWLIYYQSWFKFIMLMTLMYFLFMFTMLTELNRTPTDLIEGESELVSGFNIEYSSSLFALIFMAEYGMILLMSGLINMFYCGFFFNLYFYFLVLLTSIIVIWVRGALPRMRYDEFLYFCWKDLLVLVLFYFYFLILLKLNFLY